MPATSTIHRIGNEAIEVPPLRLLSSSAEEAERIAFIKCHLDAMERCGRRTIQHGWLVGRELVYIHEKRPDLRGRAWIAFIKKHFDLGETQAFGVMRISKAFPTLRSIPAGIDSIRGAIAHLQARREVEDAESRVRERPRDFGRWAARGDAREAGPPASPGEVESFQPSALPTSARTCAQLRTAQRQLAEIAAGDATAFRKVRDLIRRQHARVRGRVRARSETAV